MRGLVRNYTRPPTTLSFPCVYVGAAPPPSPTPPCNQSKPPTITISQQSHLFNPLETKCKICFICHLAPKTSSAHCSHHKIQTPSHQDALYPKPTTSTSSLCTNIPHHETLNRNPSEIHETLYSPVGDPMNLVQADQTHRRRCRVTSKEGKPATPASQGLHHMGSLETMAKSSGRGATAAPDSRPAHLAEPRKFLGLDPQLGA